MSLRPSSEVRRRAVPVVVALVVLVIAVFAALYLALFSHDSPKPLTIRAGPSSAPAAGDLLGRWQVGPGSEAGYRVREKLARLPGKSDAVGRTDRVTGELIVERRDDQLMVSKGARVDVDMRSLRSDEPRRDARLRTAGLQTDQFPTASFVTTFDLPLPESVLTGRPTRLLPRGEFTLHGVTRAIVVPVDAQVHGDRLELVGNMEILMGDFKIHPPDVAGLVTVDIHGAMEYRVVMTKS